MCDYSLETFDSRPAVKGERLRLEKIGIMSKGFVSVNAQGEKPCAVCCEPGMTMTLHGAEGDVDVTFAQRGRPENYYSELYYKDGVTMPDGTFVLLQTFEPGLEATVIKPLPDVLMEALKGGTMFADEPEIKEPVTAPEELRV